MNNPKNPHGARQGPQSTDPSSLTPDKERGPFPGAPTTCQIRARCGTRQPIGVRGLTLAGGCAVDGKVITK